MVIVSHMVPVRYRTLPYGTVPFSKLIYCTSVVCTVPYRTGCLVRALYGTRYRIDTVRYRTESSQRYRTVPYGTVLYRIQELYRYGTVAIRGVSKDHFEMALFRTVLVCTVPYHTVRACVLIRMESKDCLLDESVSYRTLP